MSFRTEIVNFRQSKEGWGSILEMFLFVYLVVTGGNTESPTCDPCVGSQGIYHYTTRTPTGWGEIDLSRPG